MYRIVNFGALILSSFIWVRADSPLMVELKPGLNEVTIKILNQYHSAFDSICVMVKQDDLPEGFIISPKSQYLNVPAKSKSEDGLLLCIKVDEEAKPGVYQIPLMLMDRANHSWNYALKVKLEIPKPEEYDLFQNYPNPFNANAQIKYMLMNDQEQETQLVIYDLLGKPIRTLVNKKQSAGHYRVVWDGGDEQGKGVASGIYFYKLTSGSFMKIRKMTILK